MSQASNLHATAIVIETRGFLFVGPSGSGKTSLALQCLAGAEARGLHAALVGDDQVMISRRGKAIVAEAIDTIAGLAEIRGADIVKVPSTAAAVIDFAVRPLEHNPQERLAPEEEQFHIRGIGDLPLLRLSRFDPEAFYKLMRLAERRT